MSGRVVDVHAHVFPPRLGTADHGSLRVVDEERGKIVRIGSSRSRPIPPPLMDLVSRPDAMLRQGVDVQVLSGWTEIFGYELPVDVATASAREQNEAMAEVVRHDPSRYLGLATVPLQDATIAAEVLEEAMGKLRLSGVQVGTHVAGRNLDDPGLEPFWAAAEKRRSFILIHPAQSQAVGRERLGSYYFENLLGNPFETTLAGASLIFGGVLERHPGLRICLAHGGGFLPYQLGRLGKGYGARPEARAHSSEGVARGFERLYFDTILHSPATLAFLLSLVGPERLLLGSDYPFDMAEDEPVRALAGLASDAERELVGGGNARRIFGI